MKMVQEQRLQLKMKFLLGCNMKVVIYFGDTNLMGDIFSWWRGMNKLLVSGAGGELPTIPSVGKTLYAEI